MALDEDSIAKDLGKLLTPQPLPYRATIKGKIDTVVITSKQELLLALRKYKDQYNQSILTRILLKVADDKESVWHLSEERFDYSEKMAKRLRAMLHDVQQNLTKYKNKKCPSGSSPSSPTKTLHQGNQHLHSGGTIPWTARIGCETAARRGTTRTTWRRAGMMTARSGGCPAKEKRGKLLK